MKHRMTKKRQTLLAALALLLCAGAVLLYGTMFRPVSAENAVRRAVFSGGHVLSACLLTTEEAAPGDDYIALSAFEELTEDQQILRVTSRVPRTFQTRNLLDVWVVTETEGTYTAAYLPPA